MPFLANSLTFQKSSMIFSADTSSQDKDIASPILHIPIIETLGKYLVVSFDPWKEGGKPPPFP